MAEVGVLTYEAAMSHINLKPSKGKLLVYNAAT